MPRKPADEDRERVLKTLREIIDAPGTGGRVLAAKYAASMRLSKLLGIEPDLEDEDPIDVQAPDPMDDLTEMEYWRQKRARR